MKSNLGFLLPGSFMYSKALRQEWLIQPKEEAENKDLGKRPFLWTVHGSKYSKGA